MTVEGEGHASRQGTALCGVRGCGGAHASPQLCSPVLPPVREMLSGSTAEEGAGKSFPLLVGGEWRRPGHLGGSPCPGCPPSVPGPSLRWSESEDRVLSQTRRAQPPEPALPARGSLPTKGRPKSRAWLRIPTARLWIWGSLRPLLFSPSLLLPLPFYFPAPRAWIKVTDNFPLAPY